MEDINSFRPTLEKLVDLTNEGKVSWLKQTASSFSNTSIDHNKEKISMTIQEIQSNSSWNNKYIFQIINLTTKQVLVDIEDSDSSYGLLSKLYKSVELSINNSAISYMSNFLKNFENN